MGRGVPSLRMRAHEWVLRGGVSATAARVRRRLRRGAQTVWPYPRRLRCSRGSSDITAKRRDAQAQPNKGFIFKLQRTSRDEKSYIYTIFRRAPHVSNFLLAQLAGRVVKATGPALAGPKFETGRGWLDFVFFSSFFLATTAFSPLLFFFPSLFGGGREPSAQRLGRRNNGR